MKQKIFSALAWILGILAFAILTYRIYQTFTKTDFLNVLHSLHQTQNIIYLSLSLFLMPINWGIESWKWYKITLNIENIGYKNSVLAVLTGLAFGHLLPARSSEFLGKIIFYSDNNKSNIGILHFINAAFQMYVTLFFGLMALFFYFNFNVSFHKYSQVIIVTGIILFVFISWLIIYADKLYFLKKLLPSLNYQISHSLKFELLFWSVIRYIIFVIQFYFVFKIFNYTIDFNFNFIAQIGIYFLLTSVIPMVSVVEVAIRALIGIIAFHSSGNNDLQLAIITTIIWLINLAIPSIAGFVIWLSIKKNR